MEFERKIAGYLSKSFQQGCEKNFYKSKRTFWGRWFNVNFKCLYLFLYFEQDGFRRPAKIFWTNVATAISFSRGTFWERILVQRTLDPFCGVWAKFSGRLMWTFWQGFSNCILCVQGNTEAKCNFWKSFCFRARFFRFWAKNLRPFVKKVSEVLSKMLSLYG